VAAAAQQAAWRWCWQLAVLLCRFTVQNMRNVPLYWVSGPGRRTAAAAVGQLQL
jgi:hypothetical protein